MIPESDTELGGCSHCIDRIARILFKCLTDGHHKFARSIECEVGDNLNLSLNSQDHLQVSVTSTLGIGFSNIPLNPSTMAAAAAISISSPPFTSFTLPRAMDDFHLHVRDGEAILRDVLTPLLQSHQQTIGRVLIMPNLQPPVTNARMAREYYERIMKVVQETRTQRRSSSTVDASAVTDSSSIQEGKTQTDSSKLTLLMTLYLTDHTTTEEIKEAKASGIVYACKLYPKGATTHSNQGVTNIKSLIPIFRCMGDEGLLLLIHGEVTDSRVDIFERESAFLPQLETILTEVPNLRIVLEHVTTRAGVEFIKRFGPTGRLSATITAHHLLYNRNALFDGGLNSNVYCLPILKTEQDRLSLLAAIFDPECGRYFFAGTDSAPHPKERKICGDCCSAGCFTSFASIELYVESLSTYGHQMSYTHSMTETVIRDFLCHRGSHFYGLPLNPPNVIQIERENWTVPVTMVS